ncbi:hypothetical protein F3Y22_tig00110890pilonHSYRG01693 [Hibiscus syriacus]|uniref:Reverse transcriptase zinc-binding domain-containing protein n=1 Tax=Hibiscus syriacus TaxID=106335 RepID=A0A6A2ZHP0_HIBSY|nr:hypothetical protein F3Y22_tig00110890pilonHSYRG01693 [Hibiscus syriacus]
MMTSKLPISIVNEIDRFNRRFLWGGNEEKRVPHLVAWDEVCRPKRFGWLGLRTMSKYNVVLLQKTAWRYLKQPDCLWVKAFKAINGVQGDPIHFVSNSVSCASSWSHTWRSLRFGLQGLSSGLVLCIGDGKETLFWHDNWLGHPLALNPAINADFIDDSSKVCDFITVDMEWDSNKVFAMLPMEIASQIIGYPLPKFSSMKDGYVWKLKANGQFSTRSASLSLVAENSGDLGLNFSWIWVLPVIPKWKYFIWLAWRNRLLTNAKRASWVFQPRLAVLLVDAIRKP